jgi:diaminopimelate decarboxylase
MKRLPFDKEKLIEIKKQFPTPFYLYDEKTIRGQIRKLKDAFAWEPGFREYYAVKACPNPEILRILSKEGCGMDCSSYTELMLSEAMGIPGTVSCSLRTRRRQRILSMRGAWARLSTSTI